MAGRGNIVLDAELSPAEAAEVDRRLTAFNARTTGIDDQAPLRIGARNGAGDLVGGVLGSTYAGWLYVTTLWVDPGCRRSGLGTRLLRAAEAEARRRGCRQACLTTFSYQAEPFYRSLGYQVFGELPDYPEGHRLLFLRRVLA